MGIFLSAGLDFWVLWLHIGARFVARVPHFNNVLVLYAKRRYLWSSSCDLMTFCSSEAESMFVLPVWRVSLIAAQRVEVERIAVHPVFPHLVVQMRSA